MSASRGARVRLSAVATGAGWLAALVASLWYQAPQLWRNGAVAERARELAEGLGAWTGFTLAVCAVVWCVVVLPVALAVPAKWLLARHRTLLLEMPAVALLFIGWRLDMWHTLLFEHPPDNPLKSLLFWNYAVFAAVFAWATAAVYLRLLVRGEGGRREEGSSVTL